MYAPIRVLVWGEFRQEKIDPKVGAFYPQSLHNSIAAFLKSSDNLAVDTATQDSPEHGLTKSALAATDVLVWWGHVAHDEVRNEIVERVRERVMAGMGLIVLHSGHYSKIFKTLMGTSCALRWRDGADRDLIWKIQPGHPITEGIGDFIELPAEEMYGELFDVPVPDELIFVSSFSGGEVFRSGCTWRRGAGRIFYFRPGHQTHPTYHHPQIQRVIVNAVKWAAGSSKPSIQPNYG